MSTLEYQLFYWRQLPHVQPPGATLFITFRLAGSMPAEKLQQLYAEAERRRARLSRISDPQMRAQAADQEHRRTFAQWDHVLDAITGGPTWLRKREVADLVASSLHHLDGIRYDLIAFCIMPNHVHIVFTPLPKSDEHYHSMSAIMHSIKRHTAKEANQLLQRTGQFWQHENYDRVVRNEGELNRIIRYVLNNPVKARLVERWEDWAWNYCKYLPVERD